MSNQIQFQSFNFKSNSVRVITDPNQELWFCGSDVCSILGYVNAPDAMKKHCKETGIAKRYISYPSGRKEAIFINEPNLYRLIIKSRKPEAESFEAWVFEEVLPQIRKTGQYQIQQQLALPEPEKTYDLSLTAHEMTNLLNAWFHFTILGDCVLQLVQQTKPFLHGNIIAQPEYQLRACHRALSNTRAIMEKVNELLPNEKHTHFNRAKFANLDF